jgi:hypothetical protein
MRCFLRESTREEWEMEGATYICGRYAEHTAFHYLSAIILC